MILTTIENLLKRRPPTNDNPVSAKNKKGAPRGKVPPLPLTRTESEPTRFPIEALGARLGSVAATIAARVQAPEAMAGTSVLAAATLATQAHADVQMPYGQLRPISNMFIEVSISGDRKSAVDGLATGVVQAYQTELAAKHLAECAEFDMKQAAANGRSAITALPPSLKAFLIDDLTPEGVFSALKEGSPTAGIFTDEGGRILGGHGMTEESRLRTATLLSLLWDGRSISRLRSREPFSLLAGRRMAAHIMAQPSIAAMLLADPIMRDQGLLSRLLPTAPTSMMGTRAYQDPTREQDAILDSYNDTMRSLLAAPLPMNPHLPNTLNCRPLPFSPKARAVWVPFFNDVENELRPDGKLRPVSGLGAKLAEHAARMAAVLALFENLDCGEIGADQMDAGIALARHYVNEALRLFAVPATNPDLALAEQLGAWLLKNSQGKLVSLVDVYQRGPKPIRNAQTAARLMEILERHCWVERRAGPQTVNGVSRTDVWYVVKH